MKNGYYLPSFKNVSLEPVSMDDVAKAFADGKLVWVCGTCHAKDARYCDNGFTICARCLYKKRRHRERLERRESELWPLAQLVKECLED